MMGSVSDTRDEIMSLFESIRNDGHTIIMVTHDPTNIEHTNKSINIIDGQII